MVPNSKTLREIHTTEGVTGSFNDKVLHKWLRSHNPGTEQWRKARSTFMTSVSNGYSAGVQCSALGDSCLA